MNAEARKAEREARKAEDRQWKKQSEEIEAGHSKLSKGIVPEPSGMGEPRGANGALAFTIHRLQQELVEAARLRGEEGITTMKKELEARKISDDLEGAYHEKYEAGLRKLRDDLRLAALAGAEEQTVDTLGETFRVLSRMLANASPEVRRKAVESLPAKYGVELAGSIDVQEMLEVPGNKKHPRDSPDNADESQTKRNKGSEMNGVASNSDDAEVNITEADKPESEDDASSKKIGEVPSTKETENEDDASTEKNNDESPANETGTEDSSSSSSSSSSSGNLKDESPTEDEKPNPANDAPNKISDNAITGASHPAAGTPVVPAASTQSIDEGLKPLLAHQIEKHPSTSTTTTTTVTNTTTTSTVTVKVSTGDASSCLP
jgi:hypothetical protein